MRGVPSQCVFRHTGRDCNKHALCFCVASRLRKRKTAFDPNVDEDAADLPTSSKSARCGDTTGNEVSEGSESVLQLNAEVEDDFSADTSIDPGCLTPSDSDDDLPDISFNSSQGAYRACVFCLPPSYSQIPIQ